MSSNDLAISIKNLTKNYEIYDKPINRLKQFLFPSLHKFFGLNSRKYFNNFCAVDNFSLDVKRGETIGLIGKNGSGKSTVLQILCGIIAPTKGKIYLNGRIGAILELGSGFNIEFTGRENIILSASILGLSKNEINQKLSKIIDFSELAKFIDQPIKTYSTGMIMRLAFALQISIEPDILIIDEALAVGDISFQSKCLNALDSLSARGVTILFVTHSMDDIQRICDRGVVLDSGKKIIEASPKIAVDTYKKILFNDTSGDRFTKVDNFITKNLISPTHYTYGNKKASIVYGSLQNQHGIDTQKFFSGDICKIIFRIKGNYDLAHPVYGFVIRDKYGLEIYGINSNYCGCKKKALSKDEEIQISFSFNVNLNSGTYFIGLNCTGFENGIDVAYHRLAEIFSFEVISSSKFLGLYDVKAQIENFN
jgi:teichoic acid transport system ATP-binding protein